jgi:hypothetical protein
MRSPSARACGPVRRGQSNQGFVTGRRRLGGHFESKVAAQAQTSPAAIRLRAQSSTVSSIDRGVQPSSFWALAEL